MILYLALASLSAEEDHKKTSQIALGGCRAFIVHYLPLEFQGLLEFLFGQFMNQKANGKV